MSRNYKGFLEVTALASMLFVVPIGYYYSRDNILGVQNRMYTRMFGLSEKDLQRFREIKERDEESDKKEEKSE